MYRQIIKLINEIICKFDEANKKEEEMIMMKIDLLNARRRKKIGTFDDSSPL